MFQNRSGNNLLIVGQRDEAVLAMLGVSMIALAAQVASAKLIVFDSTTPGSSERAFLEQVAQRVKIITSGKPGELPDVLNSLAEDLQRRTSEDHASAVPTFLFLNGIQNFKKLKQDDEFGFSGSDEGPTPSAQLQKLITEGPAHGIHVIATVDTFNNVNRFLGRKAAERIRNARALPDERERFRQPIDDPKASTLGLHRALLYNEHEGSSGDVPALRVAECGMDRARCGVNGQVVAGTSSCPGSARALACGVPRPRGTQEGVRTGEPFGDCRAPPADRRGRRSEHARARVLPKRNKRWQPEKSVCFSPGASAILRRTYGETHLSREHRRRAARREKSRRTSSITRSAPAPAARSRPITCCRAGNFSRAPRKSRTLSSSAA